MLSRCFLWLLVFGLGCNQAYGQQLLSQRDDFHFFDNQGQHDALYEQQITFGGETEELDFWRDQRSYESELYAKRPAAYKIYLLAKGKAYSAHQLQCNAACEHGDYYYLQASYYLQFGTDADKLGQGFENSSAEYRLLALGSNLPK
ncbi:hypothetical protein [Robiginitalea sp. IMCC43444]|uniref:hypothetical protein n=1 Tax=Robiginitalea sp. IMCC43444 TaxID=3459121 RepID=UPI004042028D